MVAGARSSTKAQAVFSDLGLQEGYQQSGNGILFVQEGVDVTRPETLDAALFEGVTQVVTCLGGVFGPLPEGGMGYIDGMSPERVEAQGGWRCAACMAVAACWVLWCWRSRAGWHGLLRPLWLQAEQQEAAASVSAALAVLSACIQDAQQLLGRCAEAAPAATTASAWQHHNACPALLHTPRTSQAIACAGPSHA